MPESRMTGSSPLARGLLGAVAARDLYSGIIPARAGFTRRAWPRPDASGDHPRSRGVYVTHTGAGIVAGGSSPLARGLRPAPCRSSPRPGIIPARAGFTRSRGGAGAAAEDHPRSRGVYVRLCCERRADGGSSPLARGLHGLVGRVDDHERIIPARAGFTRGRRGDRRV